MVNGSGVCGLKLSFSCQNCGKQFSNLKPELAGKKVRCRCGAVVRLGENLGKKSGQASISDANATSKSKPSSASSEDLLGVDLLGLEMLGEQLSGGDLGGKNSAQIKQSTPKRPPPMPPKAEQQNAKQQPPKRQQLKQVKPKQSKQPRVEAPSVSLLPRNRVPQVDVEEVSEVSPSSRSNSSGIGLPVSSAFGDAYGDLDSILDGAGDASPLRVSPRDETAPSDRDANGTPNGDSADLNARPPKFDSRTLGFMAALASGAMAFGFGLFVCVSRFQLIDLLFINQFSTHLRSVFGGVFGDTELTAGFQTMFLVLGWMLWGAAVLLMLLGAAQFINAFTKLVFQRQIAAWSDGLAAAFGIVLVFLLVALVFSQTSWANHENFILDGYERPVVAEGEHLDVVDRVRGAIDERSRSFTTWMLFAVSIPFSIFVASMVRLFTKTS
ncbi:MAG: hypothetical protein ACI87E_002527 [Mariniblastus sp.]